MSTELEIDRWSSTDTDMSAPGPEKTERARAEVVRAWLIVRLSFASRFLSRLHPTIEEAYSIDAESWRRFDRTLAGFRDFAPLVGETRAADRRRRYAKLSSLLDEWTNDPSDFDDRVAPLIEEALRETSPRHFPDE